MNDSFPKVLFSTSHSSHGTCFKGASPTFLAPIEGSHSYRTNVCIMGHSQRHIKFLMHTQQGLSETIACPNPTTDSFSNRGSFQKQLEMWHGVSAVQTSKT